MATPAAQGADTVEAQEARWNAWTSEGAAADRITRQRARIVFAALLIALACVTLAVVL